MPPPSGNRRRVHVHVPINHVIVGGLGPLGLAVVQALTGFGECIFSVVRDPTHEEQLPSVTLIFEGDPTSETVLRRAHIERASTLVSTVEGDEENALICLTARGITPNIRLVMRGESAQSIRILGQLAANAVVCPEIEMGRALVRAILEEEGNGDTLKRRHSEEEVR